MAGLKPSMRLKVNSDTYYLPNPDGSVYFRNNSGSFRMHGTGVDQWIERLLPAFNGEHTLEELTEGLPEPHRNRMYEIAATLYQNGFVRDVSEDLPHSLSPEVLQSFAPQIELLDQFGNSGAFRFQAYRQSKVLAVGSGAMLASLAAVMFESGLPKVHVLVTDPARTNRERLMELEAYARTADPEVELKEIVPANGWGEVIRPFEAVLFVSEEEDDRKLKELLSICRKEGKVLIPALCLRQTGWAGPVLHPNETGGWESARRRVHASAVNKDPRQYVFSATAGSMLAGVIVFEWFKSVTGIADWLERAALAAESPESAWPPESTELPEPLESPESTPLASGRRFFMLNLETMEGDWRSFLPHPLVTGAAAFRRVHDVEGHMESLSREAVRDRLLPLFGRLTSEDCGIFHIWEEGDLRQLPLAQCRVQAVDPLSEGPADQLPEMIAAGLTHAEARREAGLAGAEAYAARMAEALLVALPQYAEAEDLNGAASVRFCVGAGETFAEAVCRGLNKLLEEEVRRTAAQMPPSLKRAYLTSMEDERSSYYMHALSELQGAPEIALGETADGFPVVWVGTKRGWYASAGLNPTLALRSAALQALLPLQNKEMADRAAAPSPFPHPGGASPHGLAVARCEDGEWPALLHAAIGLLKRNGKRLEVIELVLEPEWKQGLAGLFGVRVRGEGIR